MTVKTIDINDKGNIYYKNGLLAVAEGQRAIEVLVIRAVKTQLNEMEFNADAGVNYKGFVLGVEFKAASFQAAVIKAVKSVPYVKTVNSFLMAKVGSVLHYNVVYTTDYGDTSLYSQV